MAGRARAAFGFDQFFCANYSSSRSSMTCLEMVFKRRVRKMLFPNTVAMATVQEHGLVALFLGGWRGLHI